MKTMPIDTSDLAIMCVTVDQKSDREGVQTTRVINDETLPLWVVNAVVSGPYGKPEVIAVTIAAKTAPTVTAGQPVQFVRLTARSWDMANVDRSGTSIEKRNGITFSADMVRLANGAAQKPADVKVPAASGSPA